jgi:hypothetical protein
MAGAAGGLGKNLANAAEQADSHLPSPPSHPPTCPPTHPPAVGDDEHQLLQRGACAAAACAGCSCGQHVVKRGDDVNHGAVADGVVLVKPHLQVGQRRGEGKGEAGEWVGDSVCGRAGVWGSA